MVDIHSHILPGVDDGAADMYETLEMAAMAVASGVTTMIATPHCNIPGSYENYYCDGYVEIFRAVEQALVEEGIPLTLYAGMEVFVTPNLPELLKEGKILSLNGGHYILLEFSFEEEGDYLNEMLQEIRALGLIPVIAHAERYRCVQRNPQIVYDWCEKGYVVQCNKGSFEGRFGKKCANTAFQLLSHNLVTVIASDAHGARKRTPYMMDAYEKLMDKYDVKYLDILFEENPRRICQDEPVVRIAIQPF
jgi:protein-tyrosine phosphatase